METHGSAELMLLQPTRSIHKAVACACHCGCTKPLRCDNETGFCAKCRRDHYRHTPYAEWGTCIEPTCGNRIRSDNQTGYCDDHTQPGNRPSLMKKCRECGVKLRADNETGFCKKHEFKKNRPSTPLRYCVVEGCGLQLGWNAAPETEHCPDHWYLSDAGKRSRAHFVATHPGDGAVRQQKHRDKIRAKLAEAERIIAMAVRPKKKPGRKPKTARFIEAGNLVSKGKSWQAAAEIITPVEEKCRPGWDRKKAGEALRVGYFSLRKKTGKADP